MLVKVKRFDNEYQLKAFGDWVDLTCSVTTSYKQGKLVMIPLGVAMQLPKGYEAHILPRSSTFKYWGLIHASSGIIDEAYSGDEDQWFFCAYATIDGEIPAGTRICQFRIFEKMPQVEFEYVDTLENPNRGGFGSTGQ